jgi:hypothetical protein
VPRPSNKKVPTPVGWHGHGFCVAMGGTDAVSRRSNSINASWQAMTGLAWEGSQNMAPPSRGHAVPLLRCPSASSSSPGEHGAQYVSLAGSTPSGRG